MITFLSCAQIIVGLALIAGGMQTFTESATQTAKAPMQFKFKNVTEKEFLSPAMREQKLASIEQKYAEIEK